MLEKVSKIFEKARSEGRTFLLEPEAKTVCKEYGIPITELKIAHTAEETVKYLVSKGKKAGLIKARPDFIVLIRF